MSALFLAALPRMTVACMEPGPFLYVLSDTQMRRVEL